MHSRILTNFLFSSRPFVSKENDSPIMIVADRVFLAYLYNITKFEINQICITLLMNKTVGLKYPLSELPLKSLA